MAKNHKGKPGASGANGPKGSGKTIPAETLGAALRANLKKRKAQASARAALDLKKPPGEKDHTGH